MTKPLLQHAREFQIGTPKDILSGAMYIINFAHHEVHEGDAFIANLVDTSMSTNDTLSLAFKTPPGTKRAHMVFDFITLTGGHVDVIENATWTPESGVLTPVFNRKRQPAMNSSMLLENSGQATFTPTNNLIANPGSLATGTIINTIYAFGANQRFSGAGRDIAEMLGKPATQYAYRFPADANSNAAQISFNWYEHTDSG